MSDPENGKAPEEGDHAATGEDEQPATAEGEKRKTMQGMGADLRLPRPRTTTVHSAKPASVQDEGEEAKRFDLDGNGSGWQSVPLTELSIPSPSDIKKKNTIQGAPTPPSTPEPDDAVEEFEDEATQMADHLIVESEAIDDEFEDEATQIGVPEEFIEEDAQIHEERLGIAQTASFGSLEEAAGAPAADDDERFEEVRRSAPEFREEQPLPQPIKSAPAAEPPPTSDEPVGEFENEKTEVLNSPFESEPAVAKLHVLEGPIAGQEFFVTQLRNTIGRGEGNSIMMADPAMSRQHLEIVKNPDDSYTLRDLQSVNGTGLNGTRVRECDLYHGDRIEAGKSTFQFLVRGGGKQPQANRHLIPAATATMSGGFPAMDPRPVAPPQDQSDQLSKLWTIITVAAGIISVILLVAIVFLLVDGGLPGMNEAKPEQSASELYLEAVEAVKSRDWSAAETKFTRAKELDDGLAIDAQIERIEKEKAARKAYESLLDRYKAGDYESVAKLAATIPVDSVYHEEAHELASKREKFATDAVYADAQSAATTEEYDKALELIDKVLEESPNHRGALALKERVEEEMQAREDEEEATREKLAAAKTPTRRSGFDLDLAKPPPKRTSRTSGSRIINFTRGYKLYRSKRFDAAADFFADIGRERSGPGAVRATRTAKDIRSFETAYSAGKRAFAGKNWSSARSSLKSAYRSDSSISGGRGYHRKELATMLATTEANLGLQALSSKRYAEAQRKLQTAKTHDSSANDVRDLDKRLSTEARALYIKAANLRKKDPRVAAELCRDIMAMTDSSDGTHQKARALLKDL